jgi:hypothetical protein
MFSCHGSSRPFQVLAALALLLPQASLAQDRDTQEIQRYVLTDAAFAKFKQASNKLAALPNGMAGDCDDESPTIAEGVANIEATPGAKAAISSTGLTPREYTVFAWSLVHNGIAAWAVSQPGGKLPPGTNPASVDFCKKHAAEIEALPKLKNSRCDDEDAEDDRPE